MDSCHPSLDPRAVLDYWTLVEFFSPYLLDHFSNSRKSIQRVYLDEPCELPWNHHPPLYEDDPRSTLEKGYHLYLGVFNVEETADRARHVFCSKKSEWQSIDWRQCVTQGSYSCFARLTVTKFGAPLFGTLSLSTLPWAHGHLLDHGASSLSMEMFWKEVHRLLIDLKEAFVNSLPRELVRLPKESANVLDYSALCQLTQILFRFAQYAPNGYPIALIEPVEVSEKVKAKDLEVDVERDVPILNSFYIQELDRAAKSLNTQKGCPLDLYLSGKGVERISLGDESGKIAILNSIKPSYLPKGRWLSDPSQKQALMQQFAINQIMSSLKEKGLFSVNGPPGTGKTTLLREIIAENMVARAEALARFSQAKQAFIGKRAVGFGDGDSIYISELHPSLLGYEMVVVSSNNIAVQNLSRELPLRRQLDASYSEASYLEAVACRLLNVDSGEVWGLISAALGNRENCRQLVERIFISQDEELKGVRIWEWAETYQGPSFAHAREQFFSCKQNHQKLVEDLELLAEIYEEIVTEAWENSFEESFQEFIKEEVALKEVEATLKNIQKLENEAQELYDLLEERMQLWNQERPHLINRFVNGKEWKEWSKQSSCYTKEKIAALENLHKQKASRQEVEKKCELLRCCLEAKEFALVEEAFWAEERRELYVQLRSLYRDVSLPKSSDTLEDPEVQKNAYYQNAALNHCRSELFVAALRLHEAWLAEVLRPKGGFRGNLMAISLLLQGKTPTTAADTILAWQSVFLLIPLMSSTFASIGRLFRYLEPQNLGWVLIDESGQALPQAAVGVIWRAKRVISIGDPFQIEPISTIPSEVVDGMAKQQLQDKMLEWAPSQISVQNLMDQVAVYGASRYVREVPYWLGAPLRVHRRCIEPMFSIANTIAYENTMVLATAPNSTFDHLPKSCWYDVCGAVSERQYVPAQGVALLEQLIHLLTMMKSPDLYVISPYREVVRQLQLLIARNKVLKKLFESRFGGASLEKWVSDAVGTVHSFQGKEAAVVFLVLGGDETTLGAIDWATRKPNLLNVAVTRACHRFFMIGDYDLWRQWPYFKVAAEKLTRVR